MKLLEGCGCLAHEEAIDATQHGVLRKERNPHAPAETSSATRYRGPIPDLFITDLLHARRLFAEPPCRVHHESVLASLLLFFCSKNPTPTQGDEAVGKPWGG